MSEEKEKEQCALSFRYDDGNDAYTGKFFNFYVPAVWFCRIEAAGVSARVKDITLLGLDTQVPIVI